MLGTLMANTTLSICLKIVMLTHVVAVDHEFVKREKAVGTPMANTTLSIQRSKHIGQDNRYA